MPIITSCDPFHKLCLFIISAILTSFLTVVARGGPNIDKQIIQRNLDAPLVHSVDFRSAIAWNEIEIFSDGNEDSDELYLPNPWVFFISSNETVLSDGTCDLFFKYLCSNPDCHEDKSTFYSQSYSFFSSTDITRLNVTSTVTSIASGAWKMKSSPLYIHNCDYENKEKQIYGKVYGQLGLGLSGTAYQNFQTPYPIFSIIFHTRKSGELIFGFNSTYVSDVNTGISLPCDLDWKMQVEGMAIGDNKLISSPVNMMFDVQTAFITLPENYFLSLKNYLFQFFGTRKCYEEYQNFHFYFYCFYTGNLQEVPPLVFSLQDGTQFFLPLASYMQKFHEHYIASFKLHNSTFSGIDSIMIGRDAMVPYYTVFEHLENQTPIITLYPRDSTNSSSVPNSHSISPDLSDSSNASQQANSPESQSVENMPIIKPNDAEVIPNSSSTMKSEQNDALIYTIVGVIIILIPSGVIVFVFRKRRQPQQNKEPDSKRQTLELNESSSFVSNHENVDNIGEISY